MEKNSRGARLKEERERLGFSQEEFAAFAGASKRSQIDWEKDFSVPNAAYLTAIAAHGADLCYILTGWPSSDEYRLHFQYAAKATQGAAIDGEEKARLQALFVESAVNGGRAAVLSADEEQLLETYRSASKDSRASIQATAAALGAIKPKAKPQKKGAA